MQHNMSCSHAQRAEVPQVPVSAHHPQRTDYCPVPWHRRRRRAPGTRDVLRLRCPRRKHGMLWWRTRTSCSTTCRTRRWRSSLGKKSVFTASRSASHPPCSTSCVLHNPEHLIRLYRCTAQKFPSCISHSSVACAKYRDGCRAPGREASAAHHVCFLFVTSHKFHHFRINTLQCRLQQCGSLAPTLQQARSQASANPFNGHETRQKCTVAGIVYPQFGFLCSRSSHRVIMSSGTSPPTGGLCSAITPLQRWSQLTWESRAAPLRETPVIADGMRSEAGGPVGSSAGARMCAGPLQCRITCFVRGRVAIEGLGELTFLFSCHSRGPSLARQASEALSMLASNVRRQCGRQLLLAGPLRTGSALAASCTHNQKASP